MEEISSKLINNEQSNTNQKEDSKNDTQTNETINGNEQKEAKHVDPECWVTIKTEVLDGIGTSSDPQDCAYVKEENVVNVKIEEEEFLPTSIVETQMDDADETKYVDCGQSNYDWSVPANTSKPKTKRVTKKRRRKRTVLREPKKYYCNICRFGTIYRHGIKSHLQKHATDKAFTCDKCEFRTKHPSALHRHKQTHHDMRENKSFQCPHCDYVGHYSSYMKTHIRRKHSPKGPFNCAFCAFTTVYKYDYQMHTKTHFVCDVPIAKQPDVVPVETSTETGEASIGDVEKEKVEAEDVKTENTSPMNVNNAFLTVPDAGSSKAYKCTYCDYTSPSLSRMKNHVIMHGDHKPFKCNHCKFKSKHSTALRRHERYQHPECYVNRAALQCNACEYNTYDPTRMRYHNLHKHQNLCCFKCMACSFSTNENLTYMRHITQNHNMIQIKRSKISTRKIKPKLRKKQNSVDLSDPLYISPSAMSDSDAPLASEKNKSFPKLGRKKKRNRITYICNHCDFKTINKVNIIEHTQIPHQGYKHICDVCKFETHNLNVYNSHHSEHKQNCKPLVCLVCGLEVSSKDELEEHAKFHEASCKIKQEQNDEILVDIDIEDNSSVAENPFSSTENPINVAKNLFGVTQNPFFNSEDPINVANNLLGVAENPSNVSLNPFCTTANPFGVAVDPFGVTKNLISVAKDLFSVGQNPFSGAGNKLSVAENPFTVNVNPFSVAETMTTSVKLGNIRQRLKSFKCIICDFSTPLRLDLSNHLKDHTPPYHCKLCGHSTRYLSSLRRHVTMHKGSEFKFKCELCDFTTSQSLYLRLHMRKHCVSKEYKCDSCPFETAYRNCIVKHVKVHLKATSQTKAEDNSVEPTIGSTRMYSCDKCSFKAFSDGRLVKHMHKNHGQPLPPEFSKKCDFCDFCTKDKWKLKVHYQRSYKTSPVKCKVCDFETMYKCVLKAHVNSHPDNVVANTIQQNLYHARPNSADTSAAVATAAAAAAANYQFIDNHLVDYLDWNDIPVLENAADEKRFRCPHCNFSSKYKHGVRRHFQRHHIRNNKQYYCNVCQFVTSTEVSLDRHIRVSKTTNALICSHCNDFTTFYKCGLAMHSKIHDKFRCSSCDYTCNSKYILVRHFMKCRAKTGELSDDSVCNYN